MNMPQNPKSSFTEWNVAQLELPCQFLESSKSTLIPNFEGNV